jgi:predicted nucleic acid-binding protein
LRESRKWLSLLPPQPKRRNLPDDDDDRLLECAEAAEADFLVTGNQKHFPKLFSETGVVSPRDFLTELGY